MPLFRVFFPKLLSCMQLLLDSQQYSIANQMLVLLLLHHQFNIQQACGHYLTRKNYSFGMDYRPLGLSTIDVHWILASIV